MVAKWVYKFGWDRHNKGALSKKLDWFVKFVCETVHLRFDDDEVWRLSLNSHDSQFGQR